MYTRILVPYDGSPTSDAALAEAIRLAHLSQGALRLLHVVNLPPWIPEAFAYARWPTEEKRDAIERAKALLARACGRVRAAGIPADSIFVDDVDRTLQEIVAEQVDAWPAELVVLGTHGRRGMSRLVLGSDAEQVLRRATVPVLMIRHGDSGEGEGEGAQAKAEAEA